MRVTTRHLRLGSGLVLLSYIALHLTNHALALWSLDLAEHGLRWSIAVWQSLPGTVALYGAAGIHFALACHTIGTRRHWRLPIIEWVRLWAGFSLPLLLIGHVVSTRLSVTLYGAEPSYRMIVTNLARSGAQGWQLALLAPGWLHGCLGLWLSLRRFATMQRAKPILLGIVVLLPLLSALGFLHMDRAVAGAAPLPTSTVPAAVLKLWREAILAGYLVLIAGAFAANLVRSRLAR
jgi:adenylate cyclase